MLHDVSRIRIKKGGKRLSLFRKKKSTPEGAQSNIQIDCTPSKSKSHAEYLFSRIGTGRDNAMKRPRGSADRRFRDMISKANLSGDCIINNGEGYFRPGEDDESEVEQYVNSELHRAKEIEDKALMMKDAYYRKKQEAINA